jgi:hypothetical protein
MKKAPLSDRVKVRPITNRKGACNGYFNAKCIKFQSEYQFELTQKFEEAIKNKMPEKFTCGKHGFLGRFALSTD